MQTLEDRAELGCVHEDIRREFQRPLPEGLGELMLPNLFIEQYKSPHSIEFIAESFSRFNFRVPQEGPMPADSPLTMSLSDFGMKVSRHIFGKTFLDLGCGFPLNVAAAAASLGAKKYIGVDLTEPSKFLGNLKKKDGEEMSVYVVQGDILNFLARRSTGDGTVFFSAGIDARGQRHPDINENTRKYLSAVYSEMRRLARPGDVAFDVGYNHINPKNAGFEKNENGIYVF